MKWSCLELLLLSGALFAGSHSIGKEFFRLIVCYFDIMAVAMNVR